MVAEIVPFALPTGLSRETARAHFRESAAVWRENPDLIRKASIIDAGKGVGRGASLWRRRGDAARWHGEAFRDRIAATFGASPTTALFETPLPVAFSPTRSSRRAATRHAALDTAGARRHVAR